jgi:hypothetical protein
VLLVRSDLALEATGSRDADLAYMRVAAAIASRIVRGQGYGQRNATPDAASGAVALRSVQSPGRSAAGVVAEPSGQRAADVPQARWMAVSANTRGNGEIVITRYSFKVLLDKLTGGGIG